MKRLLVNADDFGLSPGVCQGVLKAMREGVVSAATAMVCTSESEAALARYGPEIAGRLGLHLQLTRGAPCLPPQQVKSLVGDDGLFPSRDEDIANPDPDEILAEFRAQAQKLRSLGIEPSHIDAHHHVHRLPQVFPAYCRLALELGVPARGLGAAHTMALKRQGIATADVLLKTWFKEELTAARLLQLVERAFDALAETFDGEHTVELMTHPGLVDETLASSSSYVQQREREFEALCSEEVRQGLKDMGVQIVPPAELYPERGD